MLVNYWGKNMDECLTLLQLYAGLKTLDSSITEKVNCHLETCDACSDAAFYLAQLLLFPVRDMNAISEEKSVRLLGAVFHKLEQADRDVVSSLFSSENGREFVDNIAQFEYTFEPPSDEIISAIAQRLRTYVEKDTEKTYVPEYLLHISKSIGKAIDKLMQTTGELISVMQTPILTPALASLRSPLYDDVMLQENREKVELPFYYDPDTVLKLSLRSEKGKLLGELHFSKDEEELEIKSVSINGNLFAGRTFTIGATQHIEMDVAVEKEGTYRATIQVQM